jgi:hypothetical protein
LRKFTFLFKNLMPAKEGSHLEADAQSGLCYGPWNVGITYFYGPKRPGICSVDYKTGWDIVRVLIGILIGTMQITCSTLQAPRLKSQASG